MTEILPTLRLAENYSRFTAPDPFKKANDVFESIEDGGNYLKPISVLKGLEKNYQTKTDKDYFAQALHTYQSFVGIDNKVLLDKSKFTEDLRILNTCKFLVDEEALYALIQKCQQQQVVMFNEAHIYPRQRYLVSSLLDTLYKSGFRVLALEAAWKEDDGVQIYPSLHTGFYFREPQMANLARNARRLGFRIVSYEDTVKVASKDRELAQANNLINKTIDLNKNEKIIVLAGGAHIKEDTFANPKKWFAHYFKTITGIDPLTINQTGLDNIPFSAHSLTLFTGEELSNKLGKQYGNDIYLINQIKQSNFKIRPNVTDINLVVHLKFDPAKILTNTLILLVYDAAEYKYNDKIPLLSHVIPAATANSIDLNLPPGEYYIVVKNEIGQIVYEEIKNIP